jgi:hypothetical protein
MNVRVSFRYRLWFSRAYEAGECSSALASLDGAPLGGPLASFCGSDSAQTADQDTGWRLATFDLALDPGPHTLALGGQNTLKTRADEITRISFDDVGVTVLEVSGPRLTLTPVAAAVTLVEGATDDTRTLELATSDGTATTYSIASDASWLTLHTDGGSLGASGTTIEMTIDSTDLATGVHTASVTASAPDHDPATATVTLTVEPLVSTVLSTSFASGVDGFVYADDTFRGTARPLYAAGVHSPAGGFADGALRVNLAGRDSVAVTDGMSGGWSRSFQLPFPEVVTLSVRYRLSLAATYEPEECGQVLVAIDGVLLQGVDGHDWVVQLCGSSVPPNAPSDSGWQQLVVDVLLGSGDHTLTLGAFNNQKTSSNESMYVLVDDVSVVVNGEAQPRLVLPATSLEVALVPGAVHTRTLPLGVTDGGPVAFDATSDVAWLQVSPASGSAPGTLELSVDSRGLADGTYVGTLTVSASDHEPARLDVALTVGATLLRSDFAGGAEGFAYTDDAFRGTNAPAYASGGLVAGRAGNGLGVTLGGVNTTVITGMSGAWSRTFELPVSSQVRIDFHYRLRDSGTFEDDECSQVLASLDAIPLVVAGNDWIDQVCGATPQSDEAQDTGWRLASLTTTLGAGSHVLSIGGHTSKKTTSNEQAFVAIDDVVVEVVP